ncbi:MAG: 30S ribosomal protein THX [Bacteroidetes bacterium]|nr:30S ribosomal protein THX [Bacteroidota bacterium]
MGKGDKRSKKGKIAIGSYGVSRPRPSLATKAAATEPKAKKEKAAPKAAKPAAKKPAKKKAEE